jgi:SAM-dependent methyltransferase
VIDKDDARWRLSQVVELPTYDSKLWSKAKDFALDKIAQVEDGLKTEAYLYPEILETLSHTVGINDTMLDVGCAGGHFYRATQSLLGDRKWVGLDITPEYIKVACERYPEKDWLLGDVRELPFPDHSFDHVLCLFVLIHLDEEGVKSAMDELARVARRQILISGYFSFVRIHGHQRAFIYDIVNVEELKRPGWRIEVADVIYDDDTGTGFDKNIEISVVQGNRVEKLEKEFGVGVGAKTIRLPVNVDGEDLIAEFPVFSYVRLLKEEPPVLKPLVKAR